MSSVSSCTPEMVAPAPQAARGRPGLKLAALTGGLFLFAAAVFALLGEAPASPGAPTLAGATPGLDAGSASPAAGDPAAAPPAAPAGTGAGDEGVAGAPPVRGQPAPERANHYGEPIQPAQLKCRAVTKDAEATSDAQYPVPLPPFSQGIFPCTRCHDNANDYNTTKRNLTLEHTHIKLVHGPREQWCYGCHNPTGRDQLRLAGGRTIDYTKSYELCGQCHGTKLRDWRVGIHGRRTGCWNGAKEYLLCVHCHNPHAPKFRPVTPKPRPRKPSEIKLPETGK